MGLAGSHLGFKVGSHVGGSKIPVGIPGGIGGIPPGIPPRTNPGSRAGLAGSRLGFKVGSHVGGSKIPVGIPGGIGGIPPGIPPGTNLGSQVGLAGSRLTFLPGYDLDEYANQLSTVSQYVRELFDDVDDKEYYWKTLMSGIVDECFPLKKMGVRSKDAPYIPSSQKKAVWAKRKAAKKYHKDKKC